MSPRRAALGLFANRNERKRKSWSFERLEDRLCFSAAPLDYQVVSFSSDNAAGAAQTLLDELYWGQLQAASAAGSAAGATIDTTIDMDTPRYVVMSLPTDPLFADQWHLLNTGQEVGNPDLQHLFGVAGQDINVLGAWNMVDANGDPITGEGVLVAVIDSGVQLFHPDLAANISPTLRYNSANGTSNVNPSLILFTGGHGTSVAGIIAAVADNGLGGTGVAPGATIVPIKADGAGGGFSFQSLENALLYALQNDVDITNNSLGPPGRVAFNIPPEFTQLLRQSVVNGRDGLGMINVYASGNDAGPRFTNGFPDIGDYSSSSYNAFVNSRYTIGVGGVDHDGLYINADGTFTSYPEAGASVLVAAPTGSNGATNIADDDGYGSGIWTTDLVGDFGFNAAPLPNGFDPDRDLLPDPDYTSRFNGTSAAAPMVSGVIALMLQANPTLTFRDVQEILVRSSRQNAQFEFPTSGGFGGSGASKNTWQTNQTGPFRNPDSFFSPFYTDPFTAFNFPIADPNVNGFGFGGFFGPDTNDGSRQGSSVYEPQPALFTNGAGYTVSQGYGVYGEQIGYAHGVVDAEEAVYMALHWNELNQNINPNTELTYTTSVVVTAANLPAAERLPLNHGGFLIPGGIGGLAGYRAYWDEYFSMTPFAMYMGPPAEQRGFSYIDFAVPPSQEMDVEWVEVKVDISGGSTGLDGLRIMLVSPDGTQSELNNYYQSPTFIPYSSQPSSSNPTIAPGGTFDQTGGSFVWTFSTNRNFGESSNSEVILNPVTGEPVLQQVDSFDPVTQQFTSTMEPIFRNWEVHIENWSPVQMGLNAVEVVWHGKPIGGGEYDPTYGANGILKAQRVQGFVGIDTNGDEQFNYRRSVQTVSGSHADTSDIRDGDVTRQLDFNDNNLNGIYDEGDTINQEPFAANVVVQAYRVDPATDLAEATPVAQFLTGADGNYYFDLDPTQTYEIRIVDRGNLDAFGVERPKLEDVTTPALPTSDPAFTYLQHYKQVWRITPDWFYAPDHDNALLLGNEPGEIFFDPSTKAPVPYDNFGLLTPVPMAVKNINFLLKQDAPSNQFDVTGTVYSDLNGDGQFNGADAAAAGVFVYWDINRNGSFDSGETEVMTDASGQYTLPIDLTTLPPPVPTGNATYQIGVIRPNSDWAFTDPGHDGVETVFAGPGSPNQLVNFFIQPPGGQNPNGSGPGTIQGFVFNDMNGNGLQGLGEQGVPNFRVFIDTNLDGSWDSATEASALTGSNGSFFFPNLTPGLYRIDVVIPNEGTPAAAWSITAPAVGYREVQLAAGEAVTGVKFGLDNLADNDWGDLPDTYGTTAAANGPHHLVTPGFHLGASADGEVNGMPTPGATGEGLVGDNDDGVIVVSNGGVLKKGVNTLRVTVAGVGGLLTGWMDFNGDGHFTESERLTWTLNGNNLGGEADINPGTYDLQITIPASAVDGALASRFRWGEQGLSFVGPSAIGEVEDYFFGLNYLFGDYNHNGVVDNGDYTVWRRTQGQSVAPFTGADGNGDGTINQADYDVWRAHFGETLPGPGAGAGALLADGGDSSAGGSSVGAAAALATASSVDLVASAGSVVESSPSSPVGVSLSSASFAFASTGGSDSSVFQSNVGLGHATVAEASTSNSNQLLLDLAWAGVDDASYDAADESLYDSGQHEEAHVSDLALAAVLNDDSDWWDAL